MQQKRYHLIVDVEGCPLDKVNDEEFVKKLLTELPAKIGMSILYGPAITHGIPENPGLSGFLLIDYSHISIHTFSESSELLIDIFSCKPYDPQIVIDFLKSLVALKDENIHQKTVSWG